MCSLRFPRKSALLFGYLSYLNCGFFFFALVTTQAVSEFRQLRQAQLAYEREPGMTPTARMALKANGTRAEVDLAAALAQGDRQADGGADENRDKEACALMPQPSKVGSIYESI